MKTFLLKTFLVLSLLLTGLSGQSQIISQYVETNSGTFPKGIEIWNNTEADLDFSTSNLIIQQGTNGAVPTTSVTINSGTLAVNEVLIIGTSDMEVAAKANSVRFVFNNFTFNGDDALVVKFGGTTTDIFGQSGIDPGTEWAGGGVSSENQNIRLKSGIITGNTTGNTSGFTDPSTRFETVNTDPKGINGLEGFGIVPILDTDSGLKASVVTLNGLVYTENGGPSVSQEFSITGNNLDGSDVIIQLPAGSNFEISQTESGTYSDQITLTTYNGSASSVYARLKQGLSVSNYSDVLEISGGGSYTTGVYLDGSVLGDAFVLYEFTGDSAIPTFSPTNASLTNFNISSGNVIYGDTGNWSGSGVPYAQGDGGWDATSPATAKNFYFTLKPDPNFRANLSNISFEWRTTGAGPSAITIEINGTEIKTFNAGENTQDKFTSSLSGFQNLSEVVVRIKGWVNGSRATTGGGDFRIDDVKIDGEIINKPFDYIYEAGSWSPESPVGMSTSQDDILVVDGNLSIDQDFFSKDLQISTGASVDITNVLNIAGNLIVNGDLTFKSDASGSAQLVHSLTSMISGDITVERFIPSKRAFRLLGSPVGGQTFADSWQQTTHITGTGGEANGFDPTTTNNPSLFEYNNQIADPANGAGWNAITTTNDVMVAGTPYRILVRGDRTVDLKDNNAGSSTTTLVSKGSMLYGELRTSVELPALSAVSDHFSFVANPYQAVVDFNQVSTEELTNFIYVWDVNIGTKGGYVAVDLANNTPDPSTSQASKLLIPGQAFFVKNVSNLTSNSSIKFSPDDIASGDPQPEILSHIQLPYLNVRLYKAQDYLDGSMETDAAGVRFSDQFTTSPSDEDATKFINAEENLVVYNEKLLSIDKRKFPQQEEVIQLAIANYKQTDYTLTFNFDYLPEDQTLILVDQYLQEEKVVTKDFTYNFSVDSSVKESLSQTRFQLKFQPVTLGQDEFNLTNSVRLYPSPVKDLLTVEAVSNNPILSLELYSMLGQNIKAHFKTTNQGVQMNASSLNTGVYLLKIETEKGTTTKRFIKN